MPAHIGIRDQLTYRFGVALQYAPKSVVRAAAGMGMREAVGSSTLVHNLNRSERGQTLLSQTMGRNIDDDADMNRKLSGSEVSVMLKAKSRKRETICASYDVFRMQLDSRFNPNAKNIWSVGSARFAETLNTMDGRHGKYDDAGHASFKCEWEMFLKSNTPFDRAVQQFFAEGWLVVLIVGPDGKHSKQLKRIEASKQKKERILWTSN